MEYKGWIIEKHSYFNKGYEAYDPNDCDAELLSGRTMEEIEAEIDCYVEGVG